LEKDLKYHSGFNGVVVIEDEEIMNFRPSLFIGISEVK